MRRLLPWTTAQRRLLLALIACALALRLLVPSGWMPVIGADGGWRITVCDGMGPAAAMAAMPMTHKHAPPPHDQSDHPCAFAGLALAVALPDHAPALIVPVIESIAIVVAIGTVAIGRGLAAPPPPATGPPALL